MNKVQFLNIKLQNIIAFHPSAKTGLRMEKLPAREKSVIFRTPTEVSYPQF